MTISPPPLAFEWRVMGIAKLDVKKNEIPFCTFIQQRKGPILKCIDSLLYGRLKCVHGLLY